MLRRSGGKTAIESLLGLVLVVVGVACGASDDTPEEEPDPPTTEERVVTIAGLDGDAATGQTVFERTCGIATCHGPDGDSGPAPDLSVVGKYGDGAIARIVLGGSGEMLSLGSLSDQEIADVLAYVDATFR